MDLLINGLFLNINQDLLKITNLRINFTKLNSLQAENYYAIKELNIVGSCSCNGHASRCIPSSGIYRNNDEMIYSKCECSHNTKGLNCEKCEDFYNDLPWKPARGKEINACKKCDCNDHTNNCHFDDVIYVRSGRISGGVCDDCQHNTEGQYCEVCKPSHYHNRELDISNFEACIRCGCNAPGSIDLNCDETGQCRCKKNVEGKQCYQCKYLSHGISADNSDGCEI